MAKSTLFFPPLCLTPAIMLLFALVGCEGSLQDSDLGSSDIMDMSQDAARPGSDLATRRDLEQVDLRGDQVTPPGTAMWRVTQEQRELSSGDTVELGEVEVGAESPCVALELSSVGEQDLALSVSLSEPEPFSLLSRDTLPERLAPGSSTSISICLGTERAWEGSVTLTLSPGLSLMLQGRVVASRALLALGAETLRLSQDRGQSWRPIELPDGLDVAHGALWAEDKAWLFGQGASPLWRSSDGETWSEVALPEGVTEISGLAYGQSRFMGVQGRDVIHSQDGVTWAREVDTVDESEMLLDITWAQGRFVAVGDSLTAFSEDGVSWSAVRGWEEAASRVVSNKEAIAILREPHIQFSADLERWQTFYDICDDRTNLPSIPLFGPEGTMFSACEGTLRVRSLQGGWRRVGAPGQMPTPLLFVEGAFHAVDDQGAFFTSPTGLTWSRAEGDASGVTRMIALSEAPAAQQPPEAPVCEEGALGCIDFEQELPGLPPLFQLGLRQGGQSVVAIDDAFAFSGSRSMRVEIPKEEPGQRGMIVFEEEDFDADALSDTIYGRMMFFTAAYPVRNWHMSESNGPLSEQNMTQIQYNAGGDGARAFHNYYGDGKDCWHRADYTYPVNQWFCWQVEYDRAANTMVISVDDQEVLRMSGRGDGCLGGSGKETLWQAPMVFTRFNLGFNPFKPQEQDLTAWIDEVAISDQRLPCPAP